MGSETNFNVDPQRLLAAYERARLELLAQREKGGYWEGELSNSALSTATAISALILVQRYSDHQSEESATISKLIVRGLHWLADQQNEDGGWGDTDLSHSNIATTMLVVSAFRLTGVPADHTNLLQSAQSYIESKGGIAGLRKRYGKDKTFAVPILTNCALAGIVPWHEVSSLPFEAACLSQKFYRFLGLPVVSYAMPALIAIGQARFHHKKPLNPIARLVRWLSVKPSLNVLQRIQPESGGYLEAVPLTSFVVMSLASIGRHDHPVAEKGVRFILDSVREDGSWPIDTNLATWNTTLALNGLARAGEEIAEQASLDWLLGCQTNDIHPYTGAEPGGWGWNDLSGSVPDADDTSGALLALAAWHTCSSTTQPDRTRIEKAAAAGIDWLLHLQNRDGGWPTFCRGWGKLPFDRSGADLTAHVLRALNAWQKTGNTSNQTVEVACQRGFRFLERRQRNEGSWVPLWFGNQDHPEEENPIYGTAKVLLAYQDLERLETEPAIRGLNWLKSAQNGDGGWGGKIITAENGQKGHLSSIEETALAVEALLRCASEKSPQPSIDKGLEWLIAAVEKDLYRQCSPIGFYFAKLWYYERLYPLTFTVSALGQAIRRNLEPTEQKPASARLTNA